MKLELVRNPDDNNRVVGYKMIRESHDDVETFERIRDMYFWSIDEEVLTYDGRVSDKTTDETVELKFATKAYHKQKIDKINS
jgi:hypothetical protein